MAPKAKKVVEKKEPEKKEPEKKEAVPKKEDESKKRKAEDKKEEPPKKEAKVETPVKAAGKTDAKKETPSKKEEAAKEATKDATKEEEVDAGEKEKDAPADKRPVLKETIAFNPADCTLNVVPALGGKVLMALTEGGMQYLIAGARANVGMKAGRYMYEVKIIEALNPAESSQAARGRVPAPRQLVRLGFSTAGSPALLGETEDGVYFDSEGFFVVGKKKVAASQRFTRDQVIGVLLNLDPKSPNANTLSLFREGERIADPQPLPEHLHGKTLFPHVAFRSVTVQMLFGPALSKPLAFKCRTLQGAAQQDVTVAQAPEPKEGAFEVVLPVGFPDEGTFDWLDTFLAKHPHYVELSDRKIQEWAANSGLLKPKSTGWKSSNDKPEFNYGLPGMDDMSIRRVLNSVAPVVPRHYVVMEVKSNLISSERQEVLKRFNAPYFKKVAHVVMGEPTEEFKALQREKLLSEKQEKVDAEWRAKKLEEERKRQLEIRQKQLQEMRKKAEEQRKKAADEARKKMEEARKKAEEMRRKLEEEKKAKEAPAQEGEEAAATKEGEEEAKAEEKSEEQAAMEVDEAKEEKDEVKEEEDKKEEEEAEKKDEEMGDAGEKQEVDEAPPKVELTEEELKLWFRPQAAGISDLTPVVMSQSFAHFTIPEQDEGFHEIRFEWLDAAKSKEYLKAKVLEKKLTSRIEDLQPSQFFKEKHAAWQKLFQEWQSKQKAFKAKTAGGKGKEEKKPAAEEKKSDGEEEKGEPGKTEVEADDLDIFSVQDVCNVGNGEPLFANFALEDWALLQLRFELYLLQLAFRKDVDDPDRVGVPDIHLAFYYNRYYRKTLSPKYFGLNTNTELVEMVKDTVTINAETQVLASQLDDNMESMDIFVKLAEENRRERQRRIDAGDETAKLKFSPLAVTQQTQQPRAGAVQPGVGPAGSVAPAAGVPRPAGAQWQQARTSQQWTQAARAAYPQPGYRPPVTGRWPAAQPGYTPRQPFPQQKWR